MALLEVKDVNHYFGGLQALAGINFSVEENELVGLIGPNGAGKTTLFNIVSGFYQPSQGQVLYRGQAIGKLRPHQVTALGLARTFQNIRLWNTMTVLDNLCISQHYRLGYSLWDVLLGRARYRHNEAAVRQRAFEVLDVLGLADYAQEYPRNLPYGLQRRVEIGRALTVQPRLLLLDEPAAGMNPTDIDKLIELIAWIRREFKLTIWLIEHQMKVVMSLCERLKVLDFGKIIASGLPEEIRSNPQVIKAYLGEEEPGHAGS